MANTIKSALFVDYDSFHRSLKAANEDIVELLAQRSSVLVSAIENGKLVTPAAEDGTRRRSLIRRWYADPQLLGKNRAAVIASGFEVVDCPPLEGWERNSAAVHIVLDTIEALNHPAGYEEFILLSADADLTPMLLRLRAHNRSTVIYANEVTAASYKAIADGMIEEEAFIDLLVSEDAPPEPEAEPELETAAAPTGDRSGLEALARKIHAATNVPMFSPRTFADLFRFLAQDVGERGYHFQETAERVTEKLTEAGRNVNRRQVLFVVKGLALKGHVFSTTDTPEKLAEVFREQVLYLAGSAGVDVTEDEAALLPSWIIGRSAAPPPRPAATPPPARSQDKPPERKSVLRRRPTRPASARPDSQKDETDEVDEAPAGEVAAPEPIEAPETKPPAPATGSSHLRRLAELRAGSASRTQSKLAALRSAKAGEKTDSELPDRSSQRPKPATGRSEQTPRPSADKPAKAPKGEAGGDDALENSILAAIAQAVDVLVEDGGAPAKGQKTSGETPEPLDIADDEAIELDPESEPEPEPPEVAAEPPPDAEPSDGGDSDDIGDEIQRIIASYSKARQKS